MKLGAQFGYWTGQPNLDIVPVAQEAERLGYDSVWTGESYSSDAFTPLAWVGAHTGLWSKGDDQWAQIGPDDPLFEGGVYALWVEPGGGK